MPFVTPPFTQSRIQRLTTGAAPITVPVQNPPSCNNEVYLITTGGTGGVEVINVDKYPTRVPSLGNKVNPPPNGHRKTFIIEVLTNGADVVQLKNSDGSTNFDGEVLSYLLGVRLNPLKLAGFVGSMAQLVWEQNQWFLNPTEGTFTGVFQWAIVPRVNFIYGAQNLNGTGYNGSVVQMLDNLGTFNVNMPTQAEIALAPGGAGYQIEFNIPLIGAGTPTVCSFVFPGTDICYGGPGIVTSAGGSITNASDGCAIRFSVNQDAAGVWQASAITGNWIFA